MICMQIIYYYYIQLLLYTIIIIFLTRVTCNPSGFQKIRDNFVLGWLVFDDVSAKSAVKSKCVKTLDGIDKCWYWNVVSLLSRVICARR